MKKLPIALFLLFLLKFSYGYSAIYFVSLSGNDSNPGSIDLPWATWQKGFRSLGVGDTLLIRGGIYTAMMGAYKGSYHGVRIGGVSGTMVRHITVSAYANEVPVLDCNGLKPDAGAHYGITMDNCHYWDFYGLKVTGVREYDSGGKYPYTGSGWETADCSHMTFNFCSVSGCMNGFTLGGTNDYIYYVNCDSYLNYDYYDNGGLCNGFSGNLSRGGHVFYDGCRSWSNSDDGYDNMAGGGYITYTNCWAWRNGFDTPTIGDGDGFKLGYSVKGDEAGIQRTLYNCISTNNKLMGFDESMDIASGMNMAVYNCTSYNNTTDIGFRFYQPLGTGVTILRNNVSYLNRVNYQGRSRNISDHNSWDEGSPAVTDADFVSVTIAGLNGPRKADGSLPDISFVHLAPGSKLIDAGVDVGLPYTGKAPDLGAFETQTGYTVVPVPAFVSAVVDNATPQVIGITCSIPLANIIPEASAFRVMVNSAPRMVNTVSVSGAKVDLTLADPVVQSDSVTVVYSESAANPLQNISGKQAETTGIMIVTNNVKPDR